MAKLKEEYGELMLEDYNVEPQATTVKKEGSKDSLQTKELKSVKEKPIKEEAGRTVTTTELNK